MFGFSLAAQLFQGSAQRTWNCVTQFTNLVWYKVNHIRHPIMPRSRRRHHSRSRSRSRSHSHDRDRDAKRRKVDNLDSPLQKRSVSCEPAVATQDPETIALKKNTPEMKLMTITPTKAMSPKQVQKKFESEKKRQAKQLEREERDKVKQQEKEEKERVRLEKVKQKQDEKEQKERERLDKIKEKEMKDEQKRKEKEEKDAKRKEREDREESKRKEREEEKRKQEEKKQKAAAAFIQFFVPKKADSSWKVDEDKTSSLFMPFQVKSDMRLPPQRRSILNQQQMEVVDKYLECQVDSCSYLSDLKAGKVVGKCAETWPYEDPSDDVIIVEEDFGESICEDKPKRQKMRAKFFKFHQNRRPAYFGTWRRQSLIVGPRRPLAEDKDCFDYEVDSDDDWEEEEEQGESLNGSDDEADKENDVENDDYEVDNDFFVPHGHLSDDEVDDESTCKLSPESLKQKLKLLKDEFDQDMRAKTLRIKPRSIGCIWYNKDGSNVDDAIDRHLRPLAMITNGQIIIKKRSDFIIQTPSSKKLGNKELRHDLVPQFLKMIHGSVNKKKSIVDDFLCYMQNNELVVDLSRTQLCKCLKRFAQWKKCPEEGPMFNKYCWCVEEEVKKKFNVDLSVAK